MGKDHQPVNEKCCLVSFLQTLPIPSLLLPLLLLLNFQSYHQPPMCSLPTSNLTPASFYQSKWSFHSIGVIMLVHVKLARVR